MHIRVAIVATAFSSKTANRHDFDAEEHSNQHATLFYGVFGVSILEPCHGIDAATVPHDAATVPQPTLVRTPLLRPCERNTTQVKR